MHFPFSLPVINCFNTLRLYKLGFGMKGFDDRNWKEVEEIQDQAGTAGMFVSLTESGLQSVVQLTIILSTGRISTAPEFDIPLLKCKQSDDGLFPVLFSSSGVEMREIQTLQ